MQARDSYLCSGLSNSYALVSEAKLKLFLDR